MFFKSWFIEKSEWYLSKIIMLISPNQYQRDGGSDIGMAIFGIANLYFFDYYIS